MAHRYVQLPFRAECFGPTSATHVTVALPKISARVELASGAIVSEIGGHDRLPSVDASIALAPFLERRSEDATGPTTEISDGRGATTLICGELCHAFRSERFVLAVVSMPARQWHFVAFTVGQPEAHRFPAAWRAPMAGSGSLAACAIDGVVHVLRCDGTDIRCVSLAIPPSFCHLGPELFVTDSRVCALSGDKLLVIDASALDFGAPHAAVPVRFDPLTAGGTSDAQPATVTIVLPQTILVDHPRLKRLRLTRTLESPLVAPGARVILDDVREELPGVFRVHAWHVAGGSESVRPTAPALELDAPSDALRMASVEHAAAPTRAPDSERLVALAARHGFRAPETLVRLLRTRELDPVFGRWLDKLGLDCIEVRGLSADWDADPNLLAFCGLGNGDEYSLYVYPPSCADGQEPPVVVFRHESNLVDFGALTFDAFFEDDLRLRLEQGGDPELVKMVRDRVGFPVAEHVLGDAPPWLPLDSARRAAPASRKQRGPDPVDAALALEKQGNVLGAERALLQIYLLERENRRRAAMELRRIYRQLGWGLALENLETSINVDA